MFLKSAWYVAGWSTEFSTGTPHARTLIGEPLVFVRQEDGVLVALTDRCPHRWAPLSKGRLEGDTLRCMYHGVRFGTDGRCVEVPRQEKFSTALSVRSYPVIERHRWVWVWMGDAEMADPTLIPHVGLLDEEEDRRVFYGQLDYQANYMLVNDNLLDLSHVGFVHENTLGRRVENGTAQVGLRSGRSLTSGEGAQVLGRGIRNEAWASGKSPLMPDEAPFGDIWLRVDYMVPGIFIQQVCLFPAGTAEACDYAKPRAGLTAISDFMSCQAVTPMTEGSTRYFYSAGNRISDMSEAQARAKFTIVEAAFHEDTVMIEAQQEMIDRHPGKRMTWINADRGLILFRKIMDDLRLIEEGESACAAS